MTGKQLYDIICRFPQEILPGGLRAEMAFIHWKQESGWIGEFCFSAPEMVLPHLYMKLHLPGGELLVLKNRAPGCYVIPEGQPRLEPKQEILSYLDQCAPYIEGGAPDDNVKKKILEDWPCCLKISKTLWKWWINCPEREGNLNLRKHHPELGNHPELCNTPPPQWLLNYWTVERIANWKNPEYPLDDCTDEELELWNFGNKSIAKAYAADRLCADLPRLFYDRESGWSIEYLYFFRDEFRSSPDTWEPQYRMRFRWPSGVLIEAENLSEIFEFTKPWGSPWYVSESEKHYLHQCRLLLEKGVPTENQVNELQGLWLSNMPLQAFKWLQMNGRIHEGIQRGMLYPRWPQNKATFSVAWRMEMSKGIYLGSPEVAEYCVRSLEAAEPMLKSWCKS